MSSCLVCPPPCDLDPGVQCVRVFPLHPVLLCAGTTSSLSGIYLGQKTQFTSMLSSPPESVSDRAVLNFSWGNFKVKICLQLHRLCNTHFSKGFIIWLQGRSRGIGVRVEANTKTLKTQPCMTHTHTHTHKILILPQASTDPTHFLTFTYIKHACRHQVFVGGVEA